MKKQALIILLLVFSIFASAQDGQVYKSQAKVLGKYKDLTFEYISSEDSEGHASESVLKIKGNIKTISFNTEKKKPYERILTEEEFTKCADALNDIKNTNIPLPEEKVIFSHKISPDIEIGAWVNPHETKWHSFIKLLVDEKTYEINSNMKDFNKLVSIMNRAKELAKK